MDHPRRDRMRAGIAGWVAVTVRDEGLLQESTPMAVLAGITAGALCGSADGEADALPRDSALGRLAGVAERPHSGDPVAAVAAEIAAGLAAYGENAAELRADIAGILEDIGGIETAMLAAAEAGSGDTVIVLETRLAAIAREFAEFGFVQDTVRGVRQRIQDETAEALQEIHLRETAEHVERDRQRGESLRLLRMRAVLTLGSGAPSGGGSAETPDRCPYQGLAPFEANDADYFFGRAQATVEIVERLSRRLAVRSSILLVTGASGVGKSSLLRAGLMPALKRGMIPLAGSQQWPHLLLTPTAEPLRRLAECGAGPAGEESETQRYILVVDQFEELFTLVTDESDRQAYVEALHAIAERPGNAVVIGLRSDYWDRCAAYPQFAEAIQDGQLIVEPMIEADLRLAITGPAATAGLEIAPGLIDTILDELRPDGDRAGRYEPGALPLLSQALRNTWHRREGVRLTIAGYERSGRVRDAVRHTADEIFTRLTADERKMALRAIRRMTVMTSGGLVARRQATMSEIYAATSATSQAERDHVAGILADFADQRLVTLDENTAEIVHDALLTAWPTLRQWLEPDLTGKTVYDRLSRDATEWHDHRGDAAFLYRGDRLLSVQDAQPRWERDPASFPPPGPIVGAFLKASTQAATRAQRLKRVITGSLAALTVLALVAAVLAFRSAQETDRQHTLALSRQLAAQSEAVEETNETASPKLAAAAWQVAPTPQARQRLLVAYHNPYRGSLPGHTGKVRSVAFSPDGKILATADEKAVRLWDVIRRRQIGLPLAVEARTMAFSPDGKSLAVALIDGVRLLDVATGRTVDVPVHLSQWDTVSALAFSPDGTALAIATWEVSTDKGEVRLWDRSGRTPREGRLFKSAGRVNTLLFGPGGEMLLGYEAKVTDDEGKIRVFDMTERRVKKIPSISRAAITAMASAKDGKILVTVDKRGKIRMCSMDDLKPIELNPDDPFRSRGHIALSPDGRVLAAKYDTTVRLWDMAALRPLGSPPARHNSTILTAAVSPGGGLVATGTEDGTVGLWNIAPRRWAGGTLKEFAGWAGTASSLSHGGRLWAGGDADGRVRWWDAATRRPAGAPLPGHTGKIGALAFSADGRLLASGGDDKTVRLWNVAGRRPAGTPMTGHASAVSAVAFSPDGESLASGDSDGTIRMWNTATGRPVGGPMTGHSRSLSVVVYSPDGRLLASGDNDGIIRMWNAASGRPVGAPMTDGDGGAVRTMAFSPDGRSLAVGDSSGTIRMWNTASGRPVGAPMTDGDGGAVKTMAFSPDGRFLAGGDSDQTVRLWDLPSRRPAGAPLPGPGFVADLAFGRDGTTLIAEGDGFLARWDVRVPADLHSAVCAFAGSSLTRTEWERYAPGEEFQRTCP